MHKDDKKWIVKTISVIPSSYQRAALLKYIVVYKETFDAEPIPHKKENRARFEANTRLRLYVEKVLEKLKIIEIKNLINKNKETIIKCANYLNGVDKNSIFLIKYVKRLSYLGLD